MPTLLIFKGQQHIRIRKSGVSGNNFGGVMHADEIGEFDLHNVFPEVSESEMINGVRDYQGLYIRNTHPSVTAKGLALFSTGTNYSGTSMRWGFDPQGVGDGTTFGIGQIIANKTTTPVSVSWKAGPTRTSEDVLFLPDLPPNRGILVWFERSVLFGSQSTEDDNILIIIDTSNIVGDSGIVQDPANSNSVVTGNTDDTTTTPTSTTNTTDDKPNLTTLNNVIKSGGIGGKFLHDLFFLGNVTKNIDAQAWIDNLARFGLKDICHFAFGLLDIINATKRNQLVNGVDVRARAGYQTYNKRNINYTLLDTSTYQSIKNPSTHYNKIEQFLKDSQKNPNIDFTIVMMSTSPYGWLPDATKYPDVKLDSELRKWYHDLFVKNGVHLVICSGLNNYQRMHVLGNNNNTDNPNQLLTSEAPNYTIPAKSKSFSSGTLFVNVTSAIKKPLHDFPDANTKTYVAKKYLPLGVSYLETYSSQKKNVNGTISPPVLECRFIDYHKKAQTNDSASLNIKDQYVKEVVDRFSITIEQEVT